MKKRRYLYHWIALLAFIASCFAIATVAGAFKVEQENDANTAKRADVITIDALKSFGTLDRAAVPFLHDAHTDALKKTNKICDTCHLIEDVSGKEILSLKFKRVQDKGRQEVMDIYHDNCTACHKEMSLSGNKTGPVETCGECHKVNPGVTCSGLPIDFDKSLHNFHIEINSENCDVCHHDSNKEASCSYCHKYENSKTFISMKAASHISCIGCHREISGPVNCIACHDINEQQKISKSEDVPRLMHGQPDVILMGLKTQVKDAGNFPAKMNPVPFDHKAHEQSQDTCRICHHAELGSCTRSCHTAHGSKQGNMVTAEQSMHKPDSKRSCMGCHEVNKNRRECAGCHGGMGKRCNLSDTCLKCHTEIPKTSGEENLKPESMAAMLLESGKTDSDTINDQEIPAIVTIDKLSAQYGSVELPHRQIIESLILNINNNNLARYFHDGKETICLGCHHNSPASRVPPGCASCHSISSNGQNISKPGLKVAYHQQCMGCHDRMGIEEPQSINCVGCHKEIGLNKLYGF